MLTKPEPSQVPSRPLGRLAAAVAALVALALLGPAAGADALRVAFFPPLDRADVLAQAQGLGRALGLEVSVLTPQQLVDPAVFCPERYQLAVYTGHERYVYEVASPGDGARALLDYLGKGGTILVSGTCWPFYRPLKATGDSLEPYAGPVPQHQGPQDAWLTQAMAQLNQSPVGTFNRFLGLNISGEGTTQFEAPEETIRFTVSEAGRGLFPSLPESLPFPGSGDLRFRPASGRNLGPGVQFTAITEAVGESGKAYGPGICVVDHTEGPLAGGRVIYLWGTLVQGPQGGALLADAFRLAARHARLGGDQALAAAEDARRAAQALPRLAQLLEGLQVYPERSYFERELDQIRGQVALAVQAAEFGNVEGSRSLLAAARDRGEALRQRVVAVAE